MANRFTQRRNQGAVFKPLTFEELSAGPMMAQKMHQDALKSAEQYDAQMQALPHHSQVARGIESEIDSEIESFTKDLNEGGINEIDATDRLLQIKDKNQKLLGPGSKGAAVQGAFQERQKLKERLQEQVNDGKRSSAWMQKNLAVFDKQSQKAFNDGNITYSGRMFSDEVNVTEKISDFLNSVGKNEIIEQTGWQPVKNNGTVVWKNVESGRKFRGTPKELKQMAVDYAMQDPEIQNYLNDLALSDEQLGNYSTNMFDIFGNFSKEFKSSPSEIRNNIKNEFLNRSINTAVRANDEIFESTKYQQKNPTKSQLEGWGVVEDRKLNDLWPTLETKGDKPEKRETTPITKKIVGPKGNTVPFEEIEPRMIKALKESGLDQFLERDESGEVTGVKDIVIDNYKRTYLSDIPNALGAAGDKLLYLNSSVGKTIGNIFQIASATNPATLVQTALDFEKDIKTLGQAVGAIKYNLKKDGFKFKDLSEDELVEQKNMWNEQMNKKRVGYNKEVGKLQKFLESTGRKLSKSHTYEDVDEFNEDMNKYFEKETFKIETTSEFDSDIDLENAIDDNNPQALSERGEIIVYDKDGNVVKMGKDAYEFFEDKNVTLTKRQTQNVFNTSAGFTGSYNVAAKTEDGKTYNIMVPHRNPSKFRPIEEFNNLNRSGGMGETTQTPIMPIRTSNNQVAFTKLKKVILPKNNQVFYKLVKQDGSGVKNKSGEEIHFTTEEVKQRLLKYKNG